MRSGSKIAVVGPYPRNEGKTQGGVQAVTYYLSEGLAARGGLEVHAVTLVEGLESVQRRTSTSGVTVHLVPSQIKLGCLTGFAHDSAGIRKVLNEIQPDLVHVHTQTMYPFAALERGYPSVLTPHGVFFREAELVKGFSRRLQSRLGCLYEKNALHRAKHIIILNRYLADTFGGLLNGSQIHYIDNPIDDKFFDLPDDSRPGEILFIGVMLERKGLLHLARAASILRAAGATFRIRVVGPEGEPAYAALVKQYVSDNDLSEYFDFLGLVSEEEVMRRYAECSMLALPSFEETAPMAISQAQAAAKPVIATKVGGIPEMIEDGVTGYTVPFGDAEALADRIGKLLADVDGARTMGRKAKAIAEGRYRRSAVIDKTLAVYDQVISDSAG